MQRRNVLNSPKLSELKKNRRQALLNKSLISLGAAVVVIGTLTYLLRIPGLNISKIEISGNQVVDSGELKASVQEIIDGKYVWLFPKSNVLIYPEGEIKEKLATKYKRLDTVELRAAEKETLSLEVSEREPAYLWCGAEWNTGEEEKCYFMDKSGYIFDEAPYFSGEVYFKFYGQVGNDAGQNPTGKYFYPKNFKDLTLFKDFLLENELNPVSINLLSSGDAEVILRKDNKSVFNPKILIVAGDVMEAVAENLKASLETEPLKSGIKNKYSSLAYIDLRYGNKVYFKFND